MAINFPTSLDVFTDPTASDQLNLPSHSGQHTDLNNAVEALEAKVGINSSAVTSSHDYKIAQLEALGTATAFTPSWTNFTPGNATESWYYTQVNDLIVITGKTVLGSTSSVTGLITMNEPVGTMNVTSQNMTGVAYLRDDSPGSNYAGLWQAESANFVVVVMNTASTYAGLVGTSSTVPHSWAASDVIAGTIIYQLA